MKILSKGLILVVVPLIFGICFILWLFNGLSDVDKLVQHGLVLKDSIISYITADRHNLVARRCYLVFKYSNDPYYKENWESHKKDSQAAVDHLHALLKVDPSLPLPRLHASGEQTTMFGSLDKELTEICQLGLGQKQDLSDTSETLLPLQYASDVQTKKAVAAMESQMADLSNGVRLELFISVALMFFFVLSVTIRLNKMVDNTLSLASGSDLKPPVKGKDEIAELDHFIFKSAVEIKELEEFKRGMLGVVSNELSNPLKSIGQFLGSLSQGVFGDLAGKAKDRVDGASASIKRLGVLLADLVMLDRSQLRVSPRQTDVQTVLNEALNAIQELANQSGIETVVENQAGMIFADSDRLVQVIVNFLSNAIKFSPPGGRVTIQTSEKDGWFECRVSDQGRGIPEEFRKKVFEPYTQVDAKDATTKKGTGLGLTISRSIVEQHGGVIGVDSEVGKGTTFWFKIPASGHENSPQRTAQSDLKVHAEVAPSTVSVSTRKDRAKAKRKFSVLMQGIVIISVPLIFQLCFIALLVDLFRHAGEQVHREEASKNALVALNHMSDEYTDSARCGVMYVYTKSGSFWKLFEMSKNKAVEQLDKAMTFLGGANVQSAVELKRIRTSLEGFPSTLKEEAERLHESNATSELRPYFTDGKMPTAAEIHALVSDKAKQHAVVGQIVSLLEDKTHIARLYTPLVEVYKAQERVMATEKAIGEDLAKQRADMVKRLHQAFFAGLVVNIVISIFLVVFLMRSLTGRLKHVMENTARIVKREPLASPEKGIDDEIAYLDQVLFSTGSHIIELDNFKRDLIGIVSHELRTPLSAISATLEALGLGVFGELSEDAQSRLKVADDEARQLVSLINDLLDLEKMDAGKFIMDKAEFEIVDLVEQANEAVASLAQSKNIEVVTEPFDDSLTIFADRNRLRQAVTNLLANAIRLSPPNEKVGLSVSNNNGKVEFRIIDHGAVISDELQKKIFDRFIQADSADQNQMRASGLSLAITKAIVEQHGGTVGVSSENGHGNVFWLELSRVA
ncbi:MAG: HAMP domain-containing histidine kinase [Cyanobacteria bacterium SZAS-4]|nr:HAMP domain-containing histidine kinase [Cyanobacteria bacterium SZAS-4]